MLICRAIISHILLGLLRMRRASIVCKHCALSQKSHRLTCKICTRSRHRAKFEFCFDREQKQRKEPRHCSDRISGEKGQNQEFEKLDKTTLASLLSKFYLEARKADGDLYKTSSLNSIRAGLNRYLKDEYHHGIIDIIKDSEFVNANVSYRAATVQLKKLGSGGSRGGGV